VLRPLDPLSPEARRSGNSWFLMENHGGGSAVPGDECRWAGAAELADLPLAVPEHRAVLERWFTDAGSEAPSPPLRPPWARPGWLAPAEAWIDDRLRALGLAPAGPAAQVKVWSISCLLRVPTEGGGAVYFKAVPPLFAQEPAITRGLARRYPGAVPEVLAVEAERGWMLLREFEGREMAGCVDPAPWEAALRLLARMQIEHVGRGNELGAWGCPDRGLDTMISDLKALLAETLPRLERHGLGLTEAERAEIEGLVPRITAGRDRLADAGIPATLIHGDFHAGNVMITGGDGGADPVPLIYDWTDAARAHPFFDLLTLLPFEDSDPMAAHRERLRDAYLEPWREAGFGTPGDLAEAFELAQALAPAYHAESYRRIFDQTEDAAVWELSGGIRGMLRGLLRRAAGLPEQPAR
jgi:aminoglycoside/choline kinase family phosphotransferase